MRSKGCLLAVAEPPKVRPALLLNAEPVDVAAAVDEKRPPPELAPPPNRVPAAEELPNPEDAVVVAAVPKRDLVPAAVGLLPKRPPLVAPVEPNNPPVLLAVVVLAPNKPPVAAAGFEPNKPPLAAAVLVVVLAPNRPPLLAVPKAAGAAG